MAKVTEIRDMSDEQLRLLAKDTTEHLFKLGLQAQTERLDAPSELRKNRRLIARIKTIQREREIVAAVKEAAKIAVKNASASEVVATSQQGA